MAERDHVGVQERSKQVMTDGWREVPFGQLLEEPVRNGIYKKKEFHGRGVKIVNMGELFANPRLRDVDMRRVELSESEQRRLSVQAGDLLFARRSLVAEGAGKCSVVIETNESTAFESSIIRARPDPAKANSLFLYYYFNSPSGLHALDTIRRHVAVAGITGTDLAQLSVEIPSLAEQRAIAHVLGTLDDKIELNRRMNETLEEMARALFKSWFVDFDPVRAKMVGRWRRGQSLPGLRTDFYDLFPDRLLPSELGAFPEGWEVGTVGDLVSRRNERVGGRDAVVLSAIASGELVPSDSHFRKRVYSKSTSNYLTLQQWDIAYNPSRINIGSIGMLKESRLGAVSPVYVVARPKTAYRWYLEFTLRLAQTKAWIATLATGSVRQSLSYSDFASIPCIIPPSRVVERFDQQWERFRATQLAHSAESQVLSAQRNALLPKLVSGEVRIGELNSCYDKWEQEKLGSAVG